VSQQGYSVLSPATSSSVDKTEEALSRAVLGISKRVETREVRHAVVLLTGAAGMKAAETATAVKRLGSMLGTDSVDIEYGVSYTGAGEQLQVSVLASGLGRTRYDDYDPLLAIETNIDDSPDYALPVGLERLDSCE
jgi:cell division GTPase FtsZ